MDLEDILVYTKQQWGIHQMKAYSELIQKGLETILKNPAIGCMRQKLPDHYRCFPVGKHLIIYKHYLHVIYVSRILHQNRDFTHDYWNEND